MLGLNLYKTKLFSVIVLILGLTIQTQGQNNQKIYIENKLSKIDSLIDVKQYDKAVILINNTQNTFSFKSFDKQKFDLEYRYALILSETGEQEKALEIILKGFESLKSRPVSQLSITYTNLLAKIFVNSQNYDKAIYYNKIAFENSKLLKDTINTIKSLIRIGSFYYAKNEIDSAKIYFRKVTYFPETPATEQRIANAYNNLGVIAQNNEDYDLAKYRANQALKIKIKQKDSLGIAYSKVNIGNILHFQNDYKLAIENYKEAIYNIEEDTTKVSMNLKSLIYENLSVSYDSLKDYKSAYNYIVKSYTIKDELTNEQLAENIAEVEAKFNLAIEEKKTEEERNRVLRTQILFYGLAFVTLTFFILIFIFYKNYKLRQLNRLEQVQNDMQTKIINATIDAKEKERKNIAEILHDSVSALLSSANLHLQASRAQLNAKAPVEISKAQQIVGEASIKIRDLSHDLISSVLLKFGLAFAVNDLCEKYSNSKLTLISDDNGVKRYNQEFEIKIYNIIEELINNIIKHSKAKNASIILIERNSDKLIIQIIDDGIGFNVKKAINKNGLGLSHIEARIKVMKGVFNINSKKGEGTSIFISTPIYEPTKIENV